MQPNTISSKECQFASLESIAEGNAKTPPMSLFRRLRLSLIRHLSPSQHRVINRKINAVISWFYKLIGKNTSVSVPATNLKTEPLKPGDLVRVKSRKEIEATLNHLGQSGGCGFMADIMTPFCDTVQRVLKPMERFVNERDLRVKKCKGLILLEGVMCEGTTAFGRCDRSCFIFWREEWLEKIE